MDYQDGSCKNYKSVPKFVKVRVYDSVNWCVVAGGRGHAVIRWNWNCSPKFWQSLFHHNW